MEFLTWLIAGVIVGWVSGYCVICSLIIKIQVKKEQQS